MSGITRLARLMDLRRAVVALAVVGAGWAAPLPAFALQPGVHVDPGSPAGKEYSFPLSVQRAAANGRLAQAGQAQPLFGVGISPTGLTVGPRAGGASRLSRPQLPLQSVTQPPARTPSAAALAQLTRRGSPAPEVALIGVPVVLGGIALGALVAVLRRSVW